ncbi:MAG: PH domain-containing protein [Gemmatimonadota bacterium]
MGNSEDSSPPRAQAPVQAQARAQAPTQPGTSGRAPTPRHYRGIWALLARWLQVPLEPPSMPPGDHHWSRSFGPADSFLRYLKLQYLLVAGALGLLLGPLAVAVVFGLARDGHATAAAAVLFLGILPISLWALAGYGALQLQFDTTWYVMTDRALRTRSGIWVLKEMTITFDNVQNVKVRQGPIQRWLGMGNVVVETAAAGAVTSQQGTTSASAAVLAGVADPHDLRDRIITRMRAGGSAGLGDADEPTREAHDGIWTPAHLTLLREIREEVRALR